MSDFSAQYKVLFVCMGNICRSPAAEGVFKSFLEDNGNEEDIFVDSAGTIGYHTGDLPDHRMQAAASRRGYNLESRARQVKKKDIEEFNLIVAMDHDNYYYLNALTNGESEHIKLLGQFLESGNDIEQIKPVPDPYYGGDTGFEKVLDMIESACQPMFDYCLKNQLNKNK